MIETSTTCREKLAGEGEVERLGGTPIEGTTITGKFFRAWKYVNAVIAGKNHKAILNSCEYDEDVAVDTYDNALKNDDENLGLEHRTMIDEQCEIIKADLDAIKELRDQLLSHEDSMLMKRRKSIPPFSFFPNSKMGGYLL